MTALAAAIALTLRARSLAFGAWVRAGFAEALTAFALLAGWMLVTDGLARLHWFAPAIVWRISLGLLGLSLAGWKFFGLIVWRGLYDLTREDEK